MYLWNPGSWWERGFVVGQEQELTLSSTMAIAHRGASALAPENTLAAFITAVEIGVDAIELDVQRTKDGQLVCIHDAHLERTTDGEGMVGDRTLRQIKLLDAGSWFYSPEVRPTWPRYYFEVPTLEEAIEITRERCRLIIELKNPELYPGIEEQVAKVAPEDAIFQSFDVGCVRRMASLVGRQRCFQLWGPRAPLWRRRFEEVTEYAGGICMHHVTVSRRIVAIAHSLGLAVTTYTVNSEREMSRMVSREVDGIISDNPVLLCRRIRERLPQAEEEAS
ncbi:Glycerophosphodiester phosphodiesterase [Thermobaculum terrenum ATCC BAA-798]|mgnify:CR=1 FL=1|uniref:Glycerophosphodiester phosphodiesterase n=1 Tax=Thermobaculum terrenum (strain ATCC BAA-798 / CCMEE 7001 / YNP1) TaxID=525904 RepID=D1CIP6_THET1|nr:glycerophosphodiester phosphodiesterase [Thermobaculum terrenum]ACZ43616.1 Glycerophosphodiester phosphodiesterase [Thermobaculum terrenum ATCC BAA-798]